MIAFRIQPWLSLAAVFAFLQVAAAQQTPVYQPLEADVSTPLKLQKAPMLLSRFPTSFDIALSADGAQTWTVDIDGRVWRRPARRAERAVLVAETDCEPACAMFSADARWLAFASPEGPVALLDLDSSEIKFQDDTAAQRTVALAFSPDDRLLAGVTVGGKVRVWGVGSGKQVCEWAATPGPVQSLAFSPHGERLAIASYSHDVKLYEVNAQDGATDKSEPQTIDVGPSRITAFAFPPDGKQLAIATSEGAARVHDLTGNGEPIELGTQPFAIWSIVFEPNGRRMAAGSWDGTIKLWDARSWELLQSVKEHDESVTRMVFDDQQGLNSVGLDGRLLYWSPETPSISPSGMLTGRDDSVWVAVYSPDGKRLFVGGRGKRFELWDAEKNKLLVSRAGHATTRCAAFSPDGATLAAGGDDGTIFLCDADSGQTRTTLLRHRGAVSAVVFADEGRTLISACDGGFVKWWDAATRQEQASKHEHRQQIYCAVISPDRKWLLTGGGNWTTGDPGELLVWDRKTRRVHARLAGHKLAVWTIVFTPDGKRFLSSDSSGAVKVWNAETLTEERTLQHATWVRPLAISPDGRTLAVGRGDGAVRLWDTAAWTQRASCGGHETFTFSLQFAPDGNSLVSGGEDGSVRFWRPDVLTP